jgi:polyferredoxin
LSLAFFVFLVIRASYPPIAAPPANVFLRFDPIAGFFALLSARSVSVFERYWPAWMLLGLTALSGRFFCGWICPLGTCFDAVDAVKPTAFKYYLPGGGEIRERLAQSRDGAAPRRFRVKYLLLAVVLALALAGVNLLYFASPLVIVNRSIYEILLPQVPVLLLLLLLLAMAYRSRFWCEELCPMGALMSLVSMAGKSLGARSSPLAVVKDADACIECGACYKYCSFGVEEPLTRAESGRLRSADCAVCGECVADCPADGALSLQSFGLQIARSRGRSGRDSPVALPKGPGHGIPPRAGAPTKLTVSRGEFISSIGLGAVLLAGYGVGLRGTGSPVLRMPGAQDEARFIAECSRCQECARACPPACIKPMGLEAGLQKLWTPRFNPRQAACIFDQCGQACARVCPAGAITRLEPEQVRIGLARVSRSTCLGWNGKVCLVCQERCRFNAIAADGLRPRVLADKCTGCGACEQTCPTEPASIAIKPLGNSKSFGSGGRGRSSSSRA